MDNSDHSVLKLSRETAYFLFRHSLSDCPYWTTDTSRILPYPSLDRTSDGVDLAGQQISSTPLIFIKHLDDFNHFPDIAVGRIIIDDRIEKIIVVILMGNIAVSRTSSKFLQIDLYNIFSCPLPSLLLNKESYQILLMIPENSYEWWEFLKPHVTLRELRSPVNFRFLSSDLPVDFKLLPSLEFSATRKFFSNCMSASIEVRIFFSMIESAGWARTNIVI